SRRPNHQSLVLGSWLSQVMLNASFLDGSGQSVEKMQNFSKHHPKIHPKSFKSLPETFPEPCQNSPRTLLQNRIS
ncbi:MAG: hypothetical protein VX026_14460, partial [Myxococcota bacterium]|nr:hypothetical protein [Myxococcota bacterium]